MKPEEHGEQAYSNFDHSFDITEETIKQSGKTHQHSARNFCGYIWYDQATKTFKEEVWCYRSLVDTKENEDLRNLIECVNDKYGHE